MNDRFGIVNDRLGDIGTPSWADEDEESPGDVEMGAVAPSQPKHMEYFFKEVESIKTDIESVKKATKAIGEINEQMLAATTTEQENQLSNKLRPLVDSTNKRAKRTKTLLGLLKEETKKLLTDGEIKENDPNLRVRENLCNTLTRKFIDEMKNYQNAQQKYKTDIKKKVKRQVLIVKPNATEEEIDRVMKSEGGRDELYKQRILVGAVNDQVKTTHAKVTSKYQDVLQLEKSVAELHQMFLDFALLTEQQGELLDQIEFQVKQAADYVEDANVEVYEGGEYQKKIRKKQCWIIVIVIVAAVILLFAFGILP